jgi:hypothetical protein
MKRLAYSFYYRACRGVYCFPCTFYRGVIVGAVGVAVVETAALALVVVSRSLAG